MAQHTPNARYERLETGSSNGGEEQEKEMESVVANQSAQGAAQTQPAAQPAVQQQPPPYIIGYAPYGGQLPAPNAVTQQQTSNNNVVVATQPTAMPPVEVVNPHLKQKPTVMIVTIVLTVVCLVQFCWPALVCLTPALIAAVVACESIGIAMSMPPTAVLSGLASIMSFMLAHSNVVVDGTEWSEPVIVWITIGMPTGSGKSSLFNYFLGLLRDVRVKCGRKDIHPPWTVEESSFEKMGALMATNHGRLLGLYDELSSFLTQINLYGTKGISDSHDTSTFLMLYNGHPWTRRTVTGKANFQMDRTALSIGGFTQPGVARNIIEQRCGAERGFSQRFLWIFPQPTFAKFDSLKPVPNDISEAIVKLFQEIWTSGGGDKLKLRDWILPQDSTKFKAKFDEIQGQLEELCGRDDLLTGVLSKSKGQILRLAAVFNALFSLDPNHPLSDHLSDKAVEAAVNFVETCNEHTAIIGGRATVTDPLVLSQCSSPSGRKSKEDVAAHCLKLPGSHINLSVLLDKKKFRFHDNKSGALLGMKTLQSDELGTLEQCGGRGVHKLYNFRKRQLPAEDDEEGMSVLASKLAKYNVSIPEYMAAIRDVDVPWQVHIRTSPRKGQ